MGGFGLPVPGVWACVFFGWYAGCRLVYLVALFVGLIRFGGSVGLMPLFLCHNSSHNNSPMFIVYRCHCFG